MFDHDWNLFTNDNDHESLPQHYVPARLLHVTPQADFAWPRGWMAEKTPDRKELLETMFAGMGREVPIGQTYYDEDYLARRSIATISCWPNGDDWPWPAMHCGRGAPASPPPSILCSPDARTRARSGVCVGRGGRIFATIAYMAHNEGSPVYASDLVMITPARRCGGPTVRSVRRHDAATDRLWGELDSRIVGAAPASPSGIACAAAAPTR